MFYWQLPPFLLFGIYWTFIHPLFVPRVPKSIDYEESEDPMVTRVKRKIEVKWGWRCVIALFLWIALIVGIVLLLVKSEMLSADHKLRKRWVVDSLWETGKPIFV